MTCHDINRKYCVFRTAKYAAEHKCPRDERGLLLCMADYVFRLATPREIAAYLKRHPEAR